MAYRILIVDDEDDIREFIGYNLRREGYEVYTATNGAEALEVVGSVRPHLILLDMMMPVMDGKKLCMHIKQNISTSHIPVIMLSAKTDSKDELDALKAGADDFRTKPFSRPVLGAKIQNMLRPLHHIHDKATNSMDIAPEKMSLNTIDEEFLVKAIEVL